MNQNFALKLTNQIEQQKNLLKQHQQELENLQQVLANSREKVSSDVEQYLLSVSNTISASMLKLEQMMGKIDNITSQPELNLERIYQVLMSLQQIDDNREEIQRIQKMIVNYPMEFGQQLQHAQQIIQQQLDQHQSHIGKHFENLKHDLRLKYTAIVMLVLFLILICCTVFASKSLYTRTQELAQLNIVISERQAELEKYRFAVRQAQGQLARSNPKNR